MVGLFGGRKVTSSEIIENLANRTIFRKALFGTVHPKASGFLVGGSSRGGYFARISAHHEMLHIGQYLRKPNISSTGLTGLAHEIIPSFLGTPEIYIPATAAGLLYLKKGYDHNFK
jgi:hypothetical protein